MPLVSKYVQNDVEHPESRVGSKKSVQQGPRQFCALSVLSVREHSKLATCLRQDASAGMEPLACQP